MFERIHYKTLKIEAVTTIELLRNHQKSKHSIIYINIKINFVKTHQSYIYPHVFRIVNILHTPSVNIVKRLVAARTPSILIG